MNSATVETDRKPKAFGLASRLTGVALLAAALSAPASAVLINQTCVGGRPSGTGPCSAGDLVFNLIGLGTQSDGCINASDTITIQFKGEIAVQTSGERYDIGLFVDQAGVNAQSAGSTCAVKGLVGSIGALNDVDCSPPAPESGTGPYINFDNDSCGDQPKTVADADCDVDADGNTEATVDFGGPVTVPCKALTPDSNGFVQLASCITWGNSADQVGDITGTSGVCDGEADLHPGTGSKCNCDDTTNSNVPLPNLALTCGGCTHVSNSDSYDCTVYYTNNLADTDPTAGTNCADPSPTPATRFRCGTASFIQFVNDNSATQIYSISDFSFPTGGVPSGLLQAPSGSDSYSGASGFGTTGETLYWNPQSRLGTRPLPTGADNIVSADDYAAFTYRINVDSSQVGNGDTVENIWRTSWSNGSGNVATYNSGATYQMNGSVVEPLTVDCSFSFSTTWAAVTGVTSYKERGKTIVEWRTAGEASSLAFDLYRIDPRSGRETKVNDKSLVAVRVAPGGLYRVVDQGSGPGTNRYRIVEREFSGEQKSYGPYDVVLAPRPAGRPEMDKAGTSALVSGTPSGGYEPASSLAAPSTRAALSGKAKVEVEANGLLSLSAADLAAAMGVSSSNVSAAIGTGAVSVRQGGGDIAWVAEAGNAGLRFYGEAPYGMTARKNIYWVSLDDGSTRPMPVRNAAPKSGKAVTSFGEAARFEQDLEPRPEALQNPDDDWWFWKVVAPGVISSANVQLPISNLATAGGTIDVELFGFPSTSADGEYRANVTFNGTSLGQATWRLPHRGTFSFALPGALLANGTNTLTVGASKGVVLLDAATIRYRRTFAASGDRLELTAESASPIRVTGMSGFASSVYDITDRRNPTRLTGVSVADAGNGSFSLLFRPTAGRRYAAVGPNGFGAKAVVGDAVSSLRDTSNAANYVVLTDATLLAGAQSLADYRSSTGYQTMVVDLQDVYDEFSYGLADPKAMREFLRYATQHWATPPTHVALAGKGTWDHRDLWGNGDNFVPPILKGSILGLVASDPAIADFNDDGVPELAIGRIPAISNAELDAYVAKLESYETSSGTWKTRAIALADNGDPAASIFAADSAGIEGLLSNEGLTVTAIHLASSGAADVTAARNALFSNLATGALVLNYVGHGGFDVLADEGLLTMSDVTSIANAGKLPLFVTETCYVGYFSFPGFSALAEHLLLTSDVGTIANWSPAGLSANNSAVDLGGDLAARLAQPGTGTLGDRVRAALAAYLGNGGLRSNSNPYNLLGDPAVEPN